MRAWRRYDGAVTTTVMQRGVDDLLAAARARLHRLSPVQARAAQADGALLVDIRPLEQRLRDGDIPGALTVDRNVLEWRLDPHSPHRLPQVSGGDDLVVLICTEGYQSSLAAATLQDLGLRRATDVVDGFRGWLAAGLPVAPSLPL